MRRSVLLVTYHYLPAQTPGSRRLDTVARLLAARGWTVKILTATGARRGDTTSVPGIEVIRTTRATSHGADGQPAITSPRVSRIPLLRSVTGFPDKYAPWALTLGRRVDRLVRSGVVDVVLSSSPPHSMHAAIAAVHALHPFPWVAEFRDPWMFPTRRVLSPVSATLQRRMERAVLRGASVVIANTPGNRDELLASNPGLDPARVRVSTNGYDAALFAPGALPARAGETADFTYVGEIYGGMLERYAAAVASIRARDPDAVPRLAIYGTVHAGERRRIAELGLEPYVEQRGFVSHEESVAAMKNARALLVLLPPQERWRTCVPSKMYWYLAARRPIVALVPEGDAARLVRDAHAGEVLADPDAEALGRRLEALVREARAHPAPALSGAGTERYAMDAIVAGLEQILEEVVNGRPA
ncbi:MAG TPA: glycosyltransferase [Candidatus Krumholzibacteria bacterium]